MGLFTDMHVFRKVDRKIATDVKGKMGELEMIVVPDYLIVHYNTNFIHCSACSPIGKKWSTCYSYL